MYIMKYIFEKCRKKTIQIYDCIFFDLPERGASTQAHLSDRGRGHKAAVSQFNHERIHANPGVKSTSHFHDNIMMLQ